LDAILLVNDGALAGDDIVRSRVIDFARRLGLPTASTHPNYARHGGLMSLGIADTLSEKAAYYVHRILEGAQPSDLPVEQPTRFRLTVNLSTAKVLGLEVPPSLIARADEVID
jgi:putative tryptophan/tyrosine transport system substrate-binding protein